ncbi:unnamed protein product [Brachionus calyciflorus]|uniref:ABC-type glutathione-S-conjugate transporter n=1 Tax=Brachionus calyciflorus TaxID=104777 RepID=A0A813Q4U3_9BILA|nr:unnamed protein product [Brachionus calyciflorus]
MFRHLNETCESTSFFLSKFNVTYPEISNCYQHFISAWIPCIFLLMIIPPWIIMLNRKRFFIIKFSWLNFLKSAFNLLIILNESFFFVNQLNSGDDSVDIYLSKISSIILLISFICSLAILHYERYKGLPSGGLLFIFWGSLSLTSVISIYSKISDRINKDQNIYESRDVNFIIQCVLLYINFILNCIPETHTTYAQRRKQNYCPENEVSIFSRLTFSWMNGIILNGSKKDLTLDDLHKVDEYEQVKFWSERLEYHWGKVSKKYLKKLSDKHANDYKYSLSNKKLDQNEENLKLTPNFEITDAKIKKPSLLFSILKTFYARFLTANFLKMIREVLIVIQAAILGKLIRYIKDQKEPLIIGIFYALLLFTISCVQSCFFHQYFNRIFNVGKRIQIALMSLIYKKSLKLSNRSRKNTTVGQMVNILAVDAHSFQDSTHHLTMAWSCLFSIGLAMFMLWQQLGIAAIAGFLTMVVLLPLNSIFLNKRKILQVKKLKYQDSRVKTINELLSGIKIIKLYAWELCFKKLISNVRFLELRVLKNIALLNAIANFTWTISPFLVSVVSFGIYVFLDEKNELTAEKAFVSLSLFNSLKHPMAFFPNTITDLIQNQVSLKRIVDFLLLEEIDQNSITSDETKEYQVLIEDCNFGWDYENVLLRNISLKVKKQSLVSIVGSVGQGKSSLLSAILGEMEKFKGKLIVNGTIAYAPQQPWIQNATIRENILFGREFDQDFYEKVLIACSLKTDLEIFKHGDLTEIGEKGINLSGGQKQRISLARCIYSNADLYLLDDSLSAVDAHVGKHIFDSVIGYNGLLKDKTRIFVTNSLNFLPSSAEIVLLDNGSIIDYGPYDVLVKKNGSFCGFVKNFIESKNTEQEEKVEIIEQVQENNKINFNSKEVKEKDKLVQKEKVETGNVKSSIFINYFKACKIHLVILFFGLYALSHSFQISSSFWLSKWSNNPDGNKLYNFSIYFTIGALNCLFTLIADFLFVFMYTKAAANLHENLLHSILRCGMQFFESTPIGRILNRFAKDMESTEIKIPDNFKNFTRNLFNVLSILTVILITAPLFSIGLLPIFALFIVFQRFYARYSRQLKRLESVSRSPIYAFFAESLNGVSTIRAFQAQKRFTSQIEEHLNNNLKIFYSDYLGNRWVGLRLECTGALIVLGSALFVVFQKDTISPGTTGLTMSYTLSITLALIWVVRGFSDFESNLISVERIKEYCNLPHENEWVIEKSRPSSEWPTKGSISFKNYSVKYREELDFVLQNIDCSVKPGEKIGIVGRTGAGKSSLTLGLFRILESNYGEIKIDDINIKSIGLHDLRKKLTIIPQDPVLFSGSLRINLDPFEEYSDDLIWYALELSNLKEFVKSLEKKLEFECSEGGDNLSVGQRQLICLTRALLRKTKILILDEATASIDHNTDDLIQSTIRSQFKECTILTIAHRLNTIIDNDRIMVLDKGKLVEFDSPANLLSNNKSIFYSMAKDAGLV